MWSDALELLEEREFRGGYDREYARGYTCCDDCQACEWGCGNPKHKPGCRMADTLRELRAFVEVERQLERERDEG
jgi:hypothetical protein